jgi:hypothetical protein
MLNPVGRSVRMVVVTAVIANDERLQEALPEDLVGTRGPRELPLDEFEAARRREAAQRQFRKLTEESQQVLVTAASQNRLVFRALNDGRWTALVRALRGIELRHPEREYSVVAQEVEASTPNVLDCL